MVQIIWARHLWALTQMNQKKTGPSQRPDAFHERSHVSQGAFQRVIITSTRDASAHSLSTAAGKHAAKSSCPCLAKRAVVYPGKGTESPVSHHVDGVAAGNQFGEFILQPCAFERHAHVTDGAWARNEPQGTDRRNRKHRL